MHWFMCAVSLIGLCGLVMPCSSTAEVTAGKGPGAGPWSFGAPEEHGLDSAQLKAAAEEIGKLGGRQGIVFVRDGVIVYEEYWTNDFHLATPTQRNVSFSAAKSWGSSMVGVAVAEGLIQVNDLASKYHSPEKSGLHPDVTIKHLLTMSSGGTFVRKPSSIAPRRLDDSRPPGKGINYTYATEPEKPTDPEGYGKTLLPGTRFHYDGVPADHLADILANASGMSSHAYRTKFLLEPLGVEEFAYQPEGIDDNGNIRIGGSISLSVRDMARLGQLWLNKGYWGGKQLIDVEYIEAGTSPSELNPGYGYLWWLNGAGRIAEAPKDMFYAGGAFGQYAFVMPEQNMVIATMGFDRKGPRADTSSVWKLLDDVLP